MTTVARPYKYRVLADLVIWPDWGQPQTLKAGTILWLHGNRSSSLGGSIGTFSKTYEQALGTSPCDGTFTLKLSSVEVVY